jgi:hypothetical protein
MKKREREPESELERVTSQGWAYTLRYAFLYRAIAPSSRIEKWLIAVVTAAVIYLTTGKPHFDLDWP